ncbi:MAG: GxxExxY protein [Acidobacteria bacterium]|nr:GxxExxY protein [Acidobacteriota bacterium]
MLVRVKPALDPEREQLVERTIGCALRVHQALGPGYVEAVYHDALAIELHEHGLPFKREFAVPVFYRGRLLRLHRIDLVVADTVIVEVKAVERLEPIHQAQVVSYLKASGLRVALLVNFNTPVLKLALRRIVL